jgi:voltage-gated potassium channel
MVEGREHVSEDADALERFERQTAVPMLVLSLAIIPLLVVPLVADLSRTVESTFIAIDWLIWAAFLLEYGFRLYLAPHKRRFIRANVIDLVVIVLPFLRPLRVIRSARMLRLLRAARAGALMLRAVDAVRDVLTRHKLNYALLVTLVVVIMGALMALSFEQGVEGSNIASLPDALWWAITTVTTVGYGDRFPVTGGGRAIAVVLMVMGIALFGFLAGSLASFFLGREEEEGPDPQLVMIEQRLERIERMLAADETKGRS